MKNTDTTRILSDLIAFDTTSRNSNLALMDYVQSLLADHAIACELTYDETGKKANLFATLGASDQPGIVLSGHTDVVPVDGQKWATDPFSTKITDDKLYGRGSCDMKGFLAICLAKIEYILQAALSTPIHFAFSYDEEVGCVGVHRLLAELSKREVQPYACIIGEPTNMSVIRAHKGMLYKRCCVRGKAAHSSLTHQGVNAITMAAKVIHFIDTLAERLASEGPFDDGFDPPYTTLHTGVIHGGTVNNIISAECVFEFEIRNLPQQPTLPLFAEVEDYIAKELLPKMHAISAESGFEWRTLADYVGLDTAESAEIVKMVSALLDTTDTPGKVSYGTEGGLFQIAGIPTTVCGPGSIAQAHKPDEYVELSQLAKGERFITDLIDSLR